MAEPTTGADDVGADPADRVAALVPPSDWPLPDGSTVRVRMADPADTDAILDLWHRLSPESARLRFFGPAAPSRDRARRLVAVDGHDHVALLAERAGRVVGHASFSRLDEPDLAEFAVVVDDAEQGRGIGTALVRALAAPAVEVGVRRFVGEVLTENARMLQLLREAGVEPAMTRLGTITETTFATTPSEEFLAVGDEQDRRAAVAALESVLRPERVAVVGASRSRSSIGGLVFANLLAGGFSGAVYPVNPSAEVVQGVTAYPGLGACPRVPDLAVVCVPAEQAVATVAEAAALGVRAAVVITAGFGEAGEEGRRRERELLEAAGSEGLRLVGPNCMGVLNAAADVRMNATFSEVFPPPGRVAFSSQSGALGLAVLNAAERLGLGLSAFVSVGNKADLSGNDLLQWWEADEGTDVILLYLESFGNPRKFSRIARRVGRHKPIVAVKSGRSEAGERAAGSHTGALTAGEHAVEALFAQAGVIRVDTLGELFDVASVLANQPLPDGDGVAVLTNGGGPGILAADACEGAGLAVPTLEPATRRRLGAMLPDEAATTNPVDMIATASAEDYGAALRILAEDPNVASVLAIFVPPIVTRADDVAREVAAAAGDQPSTPVLSVFMSDDGAPDRLVAAGVPTFTFPEDAAKALGRVAAHARWRRRPLGDVVEVADADRDGARRVVEQALDDRQEAWLGAVDSERLLASFGIDTAPSRVVHTPADAVHALRELGGEPVAIKLAAPVHKTELGGVRTGVATGAEARRAAAAIIEAVRGHGREELLGEGLLVQRMVPGGVEMAVGVRHDPSFGPILMTGLGGTLIELLGDVAVRLHPVTDLDVREMVDSLRGAPLLDGYRGSEPVDRAALERLVLRVSALVEHVPEIAEMDLNPVFVLRDGVAAVDARIRLARPDPQVLARSRGWEHARPTAT